jgi:cytochrome c-type biogenesis protein CcmH/NrfG
MGLHRVSTRLAHSPRGTRQQPSSTPRLLPSPSTPPPSLLCAEANVELYPEDANAYDSLGEGYLEAGRNEESIVNYRKSLELDPKNTNAVKMLEKLGVRP